MNRSSVLVLAFSLVIGLLMIGCAAKRSEVQMTDVSQLSQAAMEGKELLERRCTACHGLDRVYSEKEDLAGWKEDVDRMIKKGAKLNAEEREKLLEYLVTLNP